MNKRVLISAIVLIIISILCLHITGFDIAYFKAIRIGFLVPLSGQGASNGESAKHSAELAVKEINNNGGVNGKAIKLITYDDHGDPQKAREIINKLIFQDQVIAVVSAFDSPTTRAAIPICQENKIPLLVTCFDSTAASEDENAFVFWINDCIHSQPHMAGALTYEAINLVAHALKVSGPDPVKLRDALAANLCLSSSK